MIRLAGLAVLVALLAGCGTIEGVGRDISDGAVTVRGWFR